MVQSSLSAADEALFQVLRQWRDTAKEQAVPAYVILHDKTLRELAEVRPVSRGLLATVIGMGSAKIEHYGAELLSDHFRRVNFGLSWRHAYYPSPTAARQCLPPCAPTIPASPARPKVVIIGGGWGGYRPLQPVGQDLRCLADRTHAEFISLPLSNRWLACLDDGRRLRQNYQKAADQLGYRFHQGEITGIDMARRLASSSTGNFL